MKETNASMEKFLESFENGVGFSEFVKNKETYRKTKADIQPMTLNTFLQEYTDECGDWFDTDSFQEYVEMINEESNQITDTQILCMVDVSGDKVSTMGPVKKKQYRKAGKFRRERMQSKYHYINPMNRIHAYCIIKHNPGGKQNTIAINVICTSCYSDQKGLGAYLIESIKKTAKQSGYHSVVLEVVNECACTKEDYQVANGEIESEESEEESGEEDDYYNEITEEVANQFWKKCVRHTEGELAVHSIDEEYILTCVSNYLEKDEDKDKKEINPVLDDEEFSYGGYYYKLGKQSNIQLFQYYESFGFLEDPKVNTEWKCFSETPFPSMIFTIKDI